MLKPVGKDYLWGGSKLNDVFDKKIDMYPLAETWECSTHPDGLSKVISGEFAGMDLATVLKEHSEYIGTHPNVLDGLPIMIKFIDAHQDLSVQVHPSDEYAYEFENGQLGKTEMWYVLDAEKDAKLIYGLRQDMEKEQLNKALGNGTLIKHLQKIPIEKDDVFFIPAGTIHAICKGALIAEIQENSNLTYRLYDYERFDKSGNRRELHIDKGLAVANLKRSNEPRQPMRVLRYRPGMASELLCRCKYFEVNRLLINTTRRQKVTYFADELSFRVLLCIDGAGSLLYDHEALNFRKGDCIFIPADSIMMEIQGEAQFLDIRG